MKNKVKVPVWYWIVSILALIWNLIGAMAYLGQAFITDEIKATMPVEQVTLLENTPAWVTAAFAFAVWGGVLGCIALLLRKKRAKPVLVISLVGLLVQLGYSFFMTNALEVYGPAQGMVMPIVLLLIGVGLVLFANSARKKTWIN